jgi:hypothetical protein
VEVHDLPTIPHAPVRAPESDTLVRRFSAASVTSATVWRATGRDEHPSTAPERLERDLPPGLERTAEGLERLDLAGGVHFGDEAVLWPGRGAGGLQVDASPAEPLGHLVGQGDLRPHDLTHWGLLHGRRRWPLRRLCGRRPMSLWASRWRTMTKLPIGGLPGYPQRVSDLTPAMPLLARLADQVVFVGVQGSRKRADEFQGIRGTSPLKPPVIGNARGMRTQAFRWLGD